MSKTCKNCGFEFAEEEKFCSFCGAQCEGSEEKIEQETPDTVLWHKPEETGEEIAQETVGETPEENEDAVIPEEASEKAPEKAHKKAAEKKRVAFGRAVGVTALSIFLAINLMLGFFVAAAIGICGTDVSEFSVKVDGKEYSVNSIVEETVELDKTGVFGFINQLLDIDKGLEIDIGGNVYELKLSEELLKLFGIEIPSSDEVSESVCDSLNIVLGTLLVVFIAVIVYLVIVVCINVYSIYSAFGKTKRANVCTGIIFLVCGAADLVLAIISAFNPELFGNPFVCAAAGQMSAVASMFIASGTVGIFGCIIFLAGILGRNRN